MKLRNNKNANHSECFALCTGSQFGMPRFHCLSCFKTTLINDRSLFKFNSVIVWPGFAILEPLPLLWLFWNVPFFLVLTVLFSFWMSFFFLWFRQSKACNFLIVSARDHFKILPCFILPAALQYFYNFILLFLTLKYWVFRSP